MTTKLEKKGLKPIQFEFDGEDYTFDFGIEEVKKLGKYSISKNGNVNHYDVVKFALLKEHKTGFITNKRAEEITRAFAEGVTLENDELEFEELIEYILGLFGQAIDEESKLYEPAIIKINKDNTVNITVNETDYHLKYNRKDIENAIEANMFGSQSPIELYTIGSSIIGTALLHTKKHPSAGLQDTILLSAWATMHNEDTKHDFANMLNALIQHMNEVLEDGVKKSKAVIKMKKL